MFENIDFDELLFLTAFACIASDGEITDEEVDLLKNFEATSIRVLENSSESNLLGEYVRKINESGVTFLEEFIALLGKRSFEKEEELKILEIAVHAILADEQIEYDEVCFFKSIRAKLSQVSNEEILSRIDSIDEYWLASDIENSNEDIISEYLSNIELPTFVIKTDEN